MFSGYSKIPTLGSDVQWETLQASFPSGTVGPRNELLGPPLNTKDGFCLFHIRLINPWESHCNIKMTSPCQIYVASQRIQELLEAFFTFSNKNKVLSGEHGNESIICVRKGYKNTSLAITICHHSASLVMLISDLWDGFSIPPSHLCWIFIISHLALDGFL